MASLRKFDMGLFNHGPADQAPPGTMRRGKGIARVNQDSIKSRWGGSLIKAISGVTTITRFAGVRYTKDAGGEWRDGAGAALTLPYDTTSVHGQPQSTVIAPVGPGKDDYLFIPGNNGMFKIASDGTTSSWGISPFPDDGFSMAIGTASEKVIDSMDSHGSWTAITADGGCTVATGGVIDIEGADSVRLSASGGDGKTCGMRRTMSFDLTVHSDLVTSPDEDYISFWIFINDPLAVEYVNIGFALNTAHDANGEAADEYFAAIRYTSGKPRKADQIGAAAQLSKREQRALARQSQGSDSSLSDFPFNDVLGDTYENNRTKIINASPVDIAPAARTWQQVRIPKDSFFRIGKGAYTWANVASVKLGFKTVANSTIVPYVVFDDLKLLGGTGLRGTYRGYCTAKNFTTGTESNPQPTFLEVADVDRQPILWTVPGTHEDAQVDMIVFYRTIGDGGLFFKATEEASVIEFLVDDIADYPGMHSTASAYLQPDELSFANIKPEGGYVDAVGPHLGRIFFTRDVSTPDDDATNDVPVAGRGSRVYYTRSGYVEGIQGFISIGSDDESCQKLVIWNRNLYCFTKKGVWQIAGTTEPFTPIQVRDVPGTLRPYSVAPTPFGIVYEAEDGFRIFNGATAPLTPSAPIAGLFQGYDLENIGEWTGSYCAAAGLAYYYVSDGDTLLCLDAEGRWRDVGLSDVSALAFETQTGLFLVGLAHHCQVLEEENVLTDNGSPIEIEWETPHIRLHDNHQHGGLRRLDIDINCNGNQLVPTLIIDGVETTLAPITNTARGMVELAQNRPARLLGLRLTGTVNSVIELFGADPDVWVGDSSR